MSPVQILTKGNKKIEFLLAQEIKYKSLATLDIVKEYEICFIYLQRQKIGANSFGRITQEEFEQLKSELENLNIPYKVILNVD